MGCVSIGVPSSGTCVALNLDLRMTYKNSSLTRVVIMFGKLHNVYLWPTIAQYIGKYILHCFGFSSSDNIDPEYKRKEAIRWCRERAISPQMALEKIGLPGDLINPTEAHPEIFGKAKQAVENHEIPFRDMKLAGAADLTLIYSVMLHSGARNVIETGVALGWSSLAILLALQVKEDGQLASIDMPYLTLEAKRDWVGLVVPPELHRRWHLYRMPDRYGITKAFRRLSVVDLVHYDSDKSYKGRMQSYGRIWQGLRSGGILISDDIGDNLAWKDFCVGNGIEQSVIEYNGKFIGLARKLS